MKPKVIFPEHDILESPYQLEDCQRRLRDLTKRHVRFTTLDDNRVHFLIRRVKTVSVPFPMIAYEIHGTLRRWGGTGTRVENYRLQRLTINIDTWVTLFIVVSLLVSVALMLPMMMSDGSSPLPLLMIILLGFGLMILPLMSWIHQIRSLSVEREIDQTHQAIMSILDIANEN